jgi:two-component system, NarL family, response regulator
LTSMLMTHSSVEVVGAASNGKEALAMVRQHTPDVILLDLRMSGMTGIEVLHALREMKVATRAIVLTSFETDENIYRAFEAGALGYLLKDTSQNLMMEAIATVHTGRRYIPPEIATRLAERMMRSSLTAREQHILQMLAKGLTNKQIGCALSISDNTVRNHVNSIMEKLEVADRTEAVTVGLQQGIIQLPQ